MSSQHQWRLCSAPGLRTQSRSVDTSIAKACGPCGLSCQRQGVFNLSPKPRLEAADQILWWARFDDVADGAREAHRTQARQAAWATQDDVHDEPFESSAAARWILPVSDQSRICGGSLHGVQGQSLHGTKRQLQTLDPRTAFLFPGKAEHEERGISLECFKGIVADMLSGQHSALRPRGCRH